MSYIAIFAGLNRQKEYEKRIKNNLTRRFLALQDSKSSMDSRLVMENLARLIMYAEKHFTPIGFFDFIGGLDNVYFLSRLEAYRKGEESTAPVIQFDSYGHQPDSRYICSLNQIFTYFSCGNSEAREMYFGYKATAYASARTVCQICGTSSSI